MKKRCKKGKSCGSTCIYRLDECLIDLGLLSKDVGELKRRINSASSSRNREKSLGSSSTPSSKAKGIPNPEKNESQAAAKDLLSRYAKLEPKITSLMQGLAERNGAKLVGLQYRLKSIGSLARKIESQRRAWFNGDANKTASAMPDVIRYTMRIPSQKYGESVKKVLGELEKNGFKVEIRNFWKTNAGPYRGLNVPIISPNGVRFELQFHTRASLKVKERIHGMYEEFRVSKDNARRRELWDKMIAESRRIPIPKGALKIGKPDELIERKFEPV